MIIDDRPYQRKSFDSVLREWDSGTKRTLLVLPTGTGKTIVFALIAREIVRRGGRVLILAHTGELIDQARAKIESAAGLTCSVEKAEEHSRNDIYRITVGSVQSMMREPRLRRFARDEFDAIIVDEAHHALAETYQRILSHFDSANVLGVTATPDRGDLRNLGEFFESVAFEYTIPQAIRDGYLCKIKALTVPVSIDITGVKALGGDYQLAQMGSALNPYLEPIANELSESCSGRKTVIFLPLIHTSQRFCEILRANGMNAREVNGESKDRKELLTAFQANEFDVLCNSMLLTEGWDCPQVDCIVPLRATKIRSLFCQMIGRGTRIYPGKDHLLVVDFLWNTARHDLCHPTSLIAESPDVESRATEKITESKTAMDIECAIEEAEKELSLEREDSLAKRLSEMKKKKRALVDPLQYAYSIMDSSLEKYDPVFASEKKAITESQMATLEKYGIFSAEIDNAGFANKLIESLHSRKVSGLTTPKQIRVLERYGFRNVGRWEFNSASKLIARIAAGGWRLPAGINVNEYTPI